MSPSSQFLGPIKGADNSLFLPPEVRCSKDRLSSRSFQSSRGYSPLVLVSGFKSFENITLIYEPDRMKNGKFSVPGPCIFSAFAISIFSWPR